MSVDFAAILVSLSALTGLIWLADVLFFAKRRVAEGGGSEVPEPIVVEYARSFFPVIFVVLLIRSFLAEPFRIPSSSMMPTLLIGDFILVNKFSYGLKWPVLDKKFIEVGEPQRGDVVVFRFPKDPSQDYIKRVVGLPGDTVEYRKKQVFVNGELVQAERVEPFIGVGSGRDENGKDIWKETLGKVEHDILLDPLRFTSQRGDGIVTVPPGHYFVLGDNRDNSEDSRFWGFVPEQNLVGKAFVVWMNWDSANGGVDFGRIGTVIH
ncbi:MAG: signal peptidase I [Xanthomonadales bacterium]|nr:signal peptidase I [Xanthomonadales bacterium]